MTHLIVGLGNPGKKYEMTRHNVGFVALEYLKQSGSFSPWRKEKKAKGFLADGTLHSSGGEVTLLLPNTYMNLSGQSVKSFVRDKKDAENMIVIHDEIDLPVGEVQISFGKGAGGHNGVRSIVGEIGTKDFVRIRIGISPVNLFGNIKKPSGKEAVSRFVLQNFTKREYTSIEKGIQKIPEMAALILAKGHLEAMNEWNEG